MNNRERKILSRLYSAIGDVPLPITGTSGQSARAEGFVTYGKDMNQVRDKMRDVLYHTWVGECDEAEEELIVIENWIKMRQGQQWRDIFPFPSLQDANKEAHP